MMNEALDYSYSYANFLLREAYNQEKMAVCINEAIMLTEGADIKDFHVLHEGLTDMLKEMWNKFVRFINKIWLKFKATFDRILDTDKGWVEKYKTIITQRPLKLEISMTDYQATIISQTHAEHFDPGKIPKMLEGNVSYLKSIVGMPGAITKYDGSEEIEDIKTAIRLAFCGGSEDEPAINAATFNMTDVYNFVHDYKEKIVKEMEKDVTAISNSSSQFQKLLRELEDAQKVVDAKDATGGNGKGGGEEPNPEGNAGGKPPGNGGNGQQTKTKTGGTSGQSDNDDPPPPGSKENPKEVGSPDLLGPNEYGIWNGQKIQKNADNKGHKPVESVIMLFNTDTFKPLQELSISGSGNGSAGAGDVNKGGMAGGVTTRSDTKYAGNANGLSGKEAGKEEAKTAAGYTKEDITKATGVYSTINQAIVSTKQTICQKMYKDYRDIIKAHIKSYVGETGEKTAGQQGTDFRQGQPQGTKGNPNPPEQSQTGGGGKPSGEL